MLLTHRGSLGRLSLCNVKCPLTPPSATPPDAGQSTALVPPSFISVWGRCTVYPVAPVQLPDTAAKSILLMAHIKWELLLSGTTDIHEAKA